MEALYTVFQASTGVETDTRKIKKGSLFFCLKGANFDGNTFAEEALKKGALFVIIDDKKFFTDEDKMLLVKANLRSK